MKNLSVHSPGATFGENFHFKIGMNHGKEKHPTMHFIGPVTMLFISIRDFYMVISDMPTS